MPGDIVTSMNGLPVGTDGTFKDYCDVIRTAGEGAPIAVEVLRYDTSEVLKGEINGDQPLELAFSFAEEVGDEVGDDSDAAAAAYDVRVGDRRPRPDLRRRPDGVDRSGTRRPARSRTARQMPVHRRLDRPRRVPQRLRRARACSSPSCRRRPTSTPRWPSTASPAAAPTAGSPTTPTPCSPASTRCGRTAAARPTTSSRWSPLPADGCYMAVIQAQIVTDADLDALDQAFDTFNSRVLTTPLDHREAGPARAGPASGASRRRRSGRASRTIGRRHEPDRPRWPLAGPLLVLLGCGGDDDDGGRRRRRHRRRRRPARRRSRRPIRWPRPSRRRPHGADDDRAARRRPRRPSTTTTTPPPPHVVRRRARRPRRRRRRPSRSSTERLVDDTGRLRLEVPTEWAERGTEHRPRWPTAPARRTSRPRPTCARFLDGYDAAGPDGRRAARRRRPRRRARRATASTRTARPRASGRTIGRRDDGGVPRCGATAAGPATTSSRSSADAGRWTTVLLLAQVREPADLAALDAALDVDGRLPELRRLGSDRT